MSAILAFKNKVQTLQYQKKSVQDENYWTWSHDWAMEFIVGTDTLL